MKTVSRLLAVSGLLSSLVLAMTACGNKATSFSLLADENNFQQNSAETNGKIDILFVIDNSGSMASSQQAVADNFQRFIGKFNEKGFDYRIAITTSDAYMDLYGGDPTVSRFRDGTDLTGHTGVHVVDPTTPDLEVTFLKNMLQGIAGSGDERVFQSIKQTLLNPANAGFPRPTAFLSVIIVSDEDDFSYDGAASIGGQYSNPALHTVDSYLGFIDGLTSATDETRSRKYNVNSIAILDQACLDFLNASSPGRKIGRRYQEISTKTNGVIGSLCGDFGTTLSSISAKIIELTTQFYLNRTPRVESLRVLVDNVEVSSDPVNGYQYHADTNSITFHGTWVPDPASVISVRFDPTSLK